MDINEYFVVEVSCQTKALSLCWAEYSDCRMIEIMSFLTSNVGPQKQEVTFLISKSGIRDVIPLTVAFDPNNISEGFSNIKAHFKNIFFLLRFL